MKALRFAVRPGHTKLSKTGETLRVIAFGIRFGYWPCLQGPFIEIAFHTTRIELWYGLPSYKAKEA